MPHLRLMGLVLFITTTFLAMAAAITQTTAIQVRNPMYSSTEPATEFDEAGQADQAIDADQPAAEGEDPDVSEGEFITVPIVIPLLIAGILGLVMWFLPAGLNTQPTKRRRRRRKRSR